MAHRAYAAHAKSRVGRRAKTALPGVRWRLIPLQNTTKTAINFVNMFR